MYTLGSLLPYAGLMTADFQSISIDEAGELSNRRLYNIRRARNEPL